MWKSLVNTGLLATILTMPVHATGDFMPDRWLEGGGTAADMSPEFFWELELRRMARDYSTPEKRVAPAPTTTEPSEGELPVRAKFTGEADVKDFDDALKTGRIKPPDAAQAKAQHEAARTVVSGIKADVNVPLPAEFASEFSDYHRGAYAYRLGAAHFGEAKAAWEAILARPKEQRHYRTIWATFMLGKLALAKKEPDAAAKWFRKVRELAREGYADSLGMAADSYGWEGRAELRQGHAEAAAKLYLTQLALGDDSAIVSLKAVIPDRPSVDGYLNYDEIPDEASQEQRERLQADAEATLQKRLDAAAQSTLLRRLVTAHVLATETQVQIWAYAPPDQKPEQSKRCARWLTTLEKAGLKNVEDADHLGWVAYTGGLYDQAARWLKVAPPESPTSLWLQAKLLRRSGKLDDATKLMAKALQLVRADKVAFVDSEFTYGKVTYSPDQSAAGDLAGLHLTRGEFVQAMTSFFQAGMWVDAAFLADRVLTLDELKAFVDEQVPEVPPKPKAADSEYTPPDDRTQLRWLLARRMVRSDREAEARPYFPAEQRAVLDRYLAALKDGSDDKAAKPARARALFTAAWIARYDGMEIMGAELEPDGFHSGGDFAPGFVDIERSESVRVTMPYDEKKQTEVMKKTPVKLALAPTAAEKKRIIDSQPHPLVRFHYRVVAAGLASKAATLLPDGSEELADVLNTAGGWVKDRDPKLAQKLYDSLTKRCAATKIGKAAKAKRWFAGDLRGPLSAPLQAERDAAKPPEQ